MSEIFHLRDGPIIPLMIITQRVPNSQEVDYNLTLCRLQSRLHTYHVQPYARVDLNSIESTLSPSRGLRIWPQAPSAYQTVVLPHFYLAI